VEKDLVLCLLSDGDTTGGNSGSAVINGRGEVIGLNFDRVWENIAGDVAYDEGRSRNIIVDLRYLFWLLDEVEDGGALLDELGVGEHRGAKRRQQVEDAEQPKSAVSVIRSDVEDRAKVELSASAKAGCGCTVGEQDRRGLELWTLALLVGLIARRRPVR
jgi:MYXO-CTERM domain-containing protein